MEDASTSDNEVQEEAGDGKPRVGVITSLTITQNLEPYFSLTSTIADEDIQNSYNPLYNYKSLYKTSVKCIGILIYYSRMSDAGDEIPVAAAEVEVTTEAPVKGKLSVEEALQVRIFFHSCWN